MRSSGFELDYEEEMALRIALEQSKVETGGSSGFGVSPQLPRQCSTDARAGTYRPAHNGTRTALSAPAQRRLLHAASGGCLCPRRWPACTLQSQRRSPRVARCSVHRRGTRRSSPCRRRETEADPDEDARLLAWVSRRSLTTTETDVHRLRRKNAKALRLGIEKSEREVNEAVAEKAQVASLKREQDRAVRRMNWLIVLSDSDSDDSDSCTSSSDDQDPAPAAYAYGCAGDRKGKGPARKWCSRSPPRPPLVNVYIVSSCTSLRTCPVMNDDLLDVAKFVNVCFEPILCSFAADFRYPSFVHVE